MFPEKAGPVVFFDGVCNLCNGAVQFILDRDKREQFRFAPLQSEAAERMLVGDLATDREALDSIIVVEDGKVYERSDAALRIARRLGAPWPAAYYLFILVPRFLRDAVYKFIARNRYRWFGRSEQCRVPTPELRARFLK